MGSVKRSLATRRSVGVLGIIALGLAHEPLQYLINNDVIFVALALTYLAVLVWYVSPSKLRRNRRWEDSD
jgi:hypothetical protein